MTGPTIGHIEPTIGRVVWYTPRETQTGLQYDGIQPLASTVCFVWPDGEVNLVVHDADGNSFSCASVPMFQGNADECPRGSCCWMPYQQKQAQKDAEEEAT